MHAAVGEGLPLVARLRAVNSQRVGEFVGAAGVRVHLHHFVVPVHDRRRRHEHVRVGERPRHGLLPEVGAAQGQHLFRRQQGVLRVKPVGRQQLLLGKDASVVRRETPCASAVRRQVVPAGFGAGGGQHVILGHGALDALGLLPLRRRLHVQLHHVRLQVTAARELVVQVMFPHVVLVVFIA